MIDVYGDFENSNSFSRELLPGMIMFTGNGGVEATGERVNGHVDGRKDMQEVRCLEGQLNMRVCRICRCNRREAAFSSSDDQCCQGWRTAGWNRGARSSESLPRLLPFVAIR